MSVQEMVAGRELDALVAERVMCWTVELIVGRDDAFEEWRDENGWLYGHSPKPFSSDIAAAWEVLVEVLSQVGTANVRLDMEDYGRGFFSDSGPDKAVWVTIGEVTVFGPAPLAICRAALAAIGASEP